MPSLGVVQGLTANQRGLNLLANWKYRRAPYRALVRYGINTTGASATVSQTATIGTTEVVGTSPVMAGGTAGLFPAPLNVPYAEFIVEPDDLIEVVVSELAGATPTVNLWIAIDPV